MLRAREDATELASDLVVLIAVFGYSYRAESICGVVVEPYLSRVDDGNRLLA